MSDDLGRLRNLGPRSREWLEEAGIGTVDTLRAIGAVEAFEQVREDRPDVSMNLLWALEGALRDVDWRELTADDKARLRRELERGEEASDG